MKKLYHLLVTSYKLRVTSYKLRVKLPRFCFAKSPLQNLKGINYPHIISSSHHVGSLRATTLLILILLLPFSAFAQPPVPMSEAEVTDVVFSCPGIVEITYDLNVCGSVNVSVSYSPDKCAWNPISSLYVTGAIGLQSSGTNKKILWNSADNSAAFGKLYFKVEYPAPADPNPNPTPVTINGVKWAPVNLDFGGRFCENPEDYGALYQWGRVADGHECSTSPCWPLASDCGTDAQGVVSLASGEQVPCPAAPCGHFIRSTVIPYDWRTRDDALWNLDENNPIKTANDPCPSGWRVPTHDELTKLTQTAYVDRGVFTTQNGVPGYVLKNIPDDNSSLFLPAAGSRSNRNGSLLNVGAIGYYWSSTPNSAYAHSLRFLSGDFTTSDSYGNRAYGMSVRCVSEN